MASKTLTGKKAKLFLGAKGALVDTGTLDANALYIIETIAETASALPSLGGVGAIFRSPDVSASAITLAAGDSVYPLSQDRNCKTDLNISFEEGTIDITDDCENGYNAMILDGYVTISGDFNGFMKIDEETGAIVTGIQDIFGKFIDVVTDDSNGVYTYTTRDNDTVYLEVLLNEDAKVGDVQNWLFVPIIMSSFSTGGGLKDATSRNISWTKADGPASLYLRTVGSSADIPGA